jgi:hypothetical protein
MIPAGYMAKKVRSRPEWLKAELVIDVCSVSSCVSNDFADYIKYWKHNGYWFFDSPDTILQLSATESIDLTGTSLFYYEVYELEFVEDDGQWTPFRAEPSITTHVVEPRRKILEGYDVVTFSVGTSAECSPLSCNSLATEVETNQHCLLSSLEVARQLLEQGRCKNTEPGPYRIFAVYSSDWS